MCFTFRNGVRLCHLSRFSMREEAVAQCRLDILLPESLHGEVVAHVHLLIVGG